MSTMSQDPTAGDYFLVQSPVQPSMIVAIYVIFVLKLGPALMKNQRPFQLNAVLLVYNLSQILANCYLFIGVSNKWVLPAFLIVRFQAVRCLPSINIICYSVEELHPAVTSEVQNLCHKYTMLKLYDFLDTVFFVLRKKRNQVSFLHVYHHVMIFSWMWVWVKYFPISPEVPPGIPIFFGVWNTLVHSIMYFYYLLSSQRPTYRNVWWKKYITGLQIVQHYAVLILLMVDFIQPECPYSANMFAFVGLNVVLLIVLFFVLLSSVCDSCSCFWLAGKSSFDGCADFRGFFKNTQ